MLSNLVHGALLAIAENIALARDFVSDLTIDCNLATAGSLAACGGVRVMGNYTRIRRVKVINWGTRVSTLPCFALSIITANPDSNVVDMVNCGIENCVALTPGSNNVGPATALNVGSQNDLAFIKEAHAKSPFIRGCFVDCGVGTPSPTGNYRGISVSWGQSADA